LPIQAKREKVRKACMFSKIEKKTTKKTFYYLFIDLSI